MKIVALATASVLLLAAPALGQADPRTACRSDYLKFCSAHRPGTPGVEQCFRDNLQKVSAGCRDAILASRGGGAAPAQRGSDYR